MTLIEKGNEKIAHLPIFSYPWIQYPVGLLDYFWVIVCYVGSAFFISAGIDGYLLPPFDPEIIDKESTIWLAIEVLLQLALQGFIAIFLVAILQHLPSPVHGMLGYSRYSSIGILVRNPAIISVILFSLSRSMQGRLYELYSRYDKNALVNIYKHIPSEKPTAK